VSEVNDGCAAGAGDDVDILAVALAGDTGDNIVTRGERAGAAAVAAVVVVVGVVDAAGAVVVVAVGLIVSA
jgi:hypothetical protein